MTLNHNLTHGPGIGETILSARGTAVHAIDGISELLSEMRGAVGDLQNVLSSLLVKVGWREDGEAEPIGAIGTEVAALLADLGQVSNALRDKRLEETCTALGGVTRDIIRRGLEFQMVAKLTAITVASLPARCPELESYADGFDQITKDLANVSGDVEAQLGRVLAARSGAIADLGAAATDLGRVSVILEAEARQALTSVNRSLEQDIATTASALKACARLELGNLVEAIQFADAFSQRAEHIAMALSLAEAAAGPRRRALERVAVALTDDLIAGARATAANLRASIARLGDEGEAAMAVLEARLQNGALAAALSERERRLAQAAASVSQVAPRIDTIQRRTHEIGRLAAGVKRALADLVGISGRIKISSINAGFIASRISSANGPLSVLATATQDKALACSQDIEKCSSGIYVLIGAIDDLNLEKLRLELEAVSGTAATLTEDASGASGATNSLAAVSSRIAGILVVLDRIGTEVTRKLADVEGALAAFDDAILQVRETSNADVDGLDTDGLDDLCKIYTMQRERDVHNAALGREVQAAAVPDQESLDDIFF